MQRQIMYVDQDGNPIEEEEEELEDDGDEDGEEEVEEEDEEGGYEEEQDVVVNWNRNDPPVRNLVVSKPDENLHKTRSTEDMVDVYSPFNDKRKRSKKIESLNRCKSDNETAAP